jgi:hypothetical protein
MLKAVSILGLLATALAARQAAAFGTQEHQTIGAESYRSACGRLFGDGAAARAIPEDAARDARLLLACGARRGDPRGDVETLRLEDRARLYGQAVSLAGDMLGTPEQFFSAVGGRNVISRTSYLALALVNSAHFHPESVRTWRRYHVDSTAEALAAARLVAGTAQIAAFEHAAYLHAFADHFLEDSFAAGHMGFNRPASSASASYVFHNRFNERGRIMFNARGDVWIGYGDGRLGAPENVRNRALVIEANTSAVLAFLRAFIDGRIDGEEERTVELVVPAAFYAVSSPGYVVPLLRRYLDPGALALDAVRAEIEAASDDGKRRAVGREPWRDRREGETQTNDEVLRQSTRALNDRAYKDVGLSAGWWYGGVNAAEADAGNLQAVVGSVALRALVNGVRLQIYAGLAYAPRVNAIYGPALAWQFATSLRGLITHELVGGVFGHLRCVTCLNQLVSAAGYRLNLEAGRNILGFQLMPAAVDIDGRWTLGWLASVSLEVLLSASGGGPL